MSFSTYPLMIHLVLSGHLRPMSGLFLIIILLNVDSLVLSADPWCSLGMLMISKKETVQSDQKSKEIF